MTRRFLLTSLLVASLGATTMPTTPATPTTPTTTRPSSPSSSSRRGGYSDRYGLLEDRNIFVRERSSRRGSGRSTTSSTQPSEPKPLEERFVLTGVVLEADGFRAYIENDRFESLRLAPGDKIARGRIASIVIDAIAYEPLVDSSGTASATTTTQSTSPSPTSAQRVWVEIGCDLTGKPSSMLASSSSLASSSADGATTGPTTGPVIASDVARLNPNDPNLTPEQRMKLRRAMELQKK